MSFFLFLVFFFKQKTAYEMRISDWSSDVCSSDLDRVLQRAVILERLHDLRDRRALLADGDVDAEQLLALVVAGGVVDRLLVDEGIDRDGGLEIGRASCRARVCPYV